MKPWLTGGCNEGLIRQELSWEHTFDGYMELLNAVQHRKVQGRFANRAAAIIIGFLLRINQELEPFTLYEIETGLKKFNKNVRESVENKTVLKTILSLEPTLTRQRKLPKHGRILTKLGFKDLKLVPLAHGFTFPKLPMYLAELKALGAFSMASKEMKIVTRRWILQANRVCTTLLIGMGT